RGCPRCEPTARSSPPLRPWTRCPRCEPTARSSPPPRPWTRRLAVHDSPPDKEHIMTVLRRSLWWLALALPAGPGGARADLFVSDEGTNAVLEYNGTTGAFVKSFASGGGLARPGGLVFGPNGDLFVSSVLGDEVLEYNGTTGAFVKSFASGGGLS